MRLTKYKQLHPDIPPAVQQMFTSLFTYLLEPHIVPSLIVKVEIIINIITILSLYYQYNSQYNQNGHFLFTCASWSHDAAIINRLKHVRSPYKQLIC